jgi:lipopolysaccharide assembly protein A
MKAISTFIRICVSAVIFVLALGLAVSNMAIVEVRFWGLEYYWKAPLVVFLLAFFAAGIAFGILAVSPTLFKQRREVGKLKKHISKSDAAVESAKKSAVAVPVVGSNAGTGTVTPLIASRPYKDS